MMEKEILSESLTDLSENFDELYYLFSSTKKRLETFLKESEKQKHHIPSFQEIQKIAQQHITTYEKASRHIQKFSQTKIPSQKNIQLLSEQYTYLYDQFRNYQSIIAGIITATDWQSPSFNHAMHAMAGRETGKIVANYNDYKRDQHIDARDYAQKFRNEYIEGLFKFTIPTYMVSSGMAALTTILNFLEMEQKITGPILLGSSSYFQNKELIKRLFTGVIEVHEHDTESIKEIIKSKRPSVIFFDSLCNSYDIAIPHLSEIVDVLKKTATKDTYIIIDNTCLASSFQPLQLLGKFPKHMHMIVFESMNKYYQFGMDKSMGGVIYGYGKDLDKLFFTRQHSGTIISDIACYMLPVPNKKILVKRLARHQRNTNILIKAITEYVTSHAKHPIRQIVYPTQPQHPSYEWSKEYMFHGSYFTFAWQQKYEKLTMYQTFIKHVLAEAKKEKAHITEGTSFGFNSSRIYLTAKNTKFGKPFLRFSVGTENRFEIERIKNALLSALKKL